MALGIRSLQGLFRSIRTRERPALEGAPFFLILLGVSVVLFARHPATNFVFDEQEALLANPFLNGSDGLGKVFFLDFWGLPPERTIGSYRPLPSAFWKCLAKTLTLGTPYYFLIGNLVSHALVAREVGLLAESLGGAKGRGHLAALTTVCLAIAVEAVSGAVGLADVWVTFFALTATRVALRDGKSWFDPLWLFALTLAGFLSKETMVGVVPLVVFSVWARKKGFGHSFLATLSLALSFLGSVLLRRFCFPTAARAGDATLARAGEIGRLVDRFLKLLSQPALPVDRINNPLLDAGFLDRISTALDVYGRSFLSVFFPLSLSGDYSFSETRVHAFDGRSALGLVVLLTLFAGIVFGARKKNFAVGFGAAWILVTSLPSANFVVLLPTVRADRLWYLPCVGVSLLVAALVNSLTRAGRREIALLGFATFFGFQASFARAHANDYTDDLSFWRATATAAPGSAKAHLNLGVMLGARGDSAARLAESRRAVARAPEWAMGRVYLGDILCRLNRTDEAWLEYRRGLRSGADQRALVALALQCLWDKGAFERHAEELSVLAARAPGSWLAYLVNETLLHGEENHGVPPRYRPRGYNERGVSGKSSQ